MYALQILCHYDLYLRNGSHFVWRLHIAHPYTSTLYPNIQKYLGRCDLFKNVQVFCYQKFLYGFAVGHKDLVQGLKPLLYSYYLSNAKQAQVLWTYLLETVA